MHSSMHSSALVILLLCKRRHSDLHSKSSSGRSLRKHKKGTHVFKTIYGKVRYVSDYGCVNAACQRVKSASLILDLDLALLSLKPSSKCCSAAAIVAGLKASRLSSSHPRSGRENSPDDKTQSLIAQRSALASA